MKFSVVWLATSMALLGCEAGPTTASTPQVASTSGDARATAPQVVDIAVAGWPARSSVDEQLRQSLGQDQLSAIDGSLIPVLMPKRTGLLARPVVIVKPAYYSLALPGTDADAGVSVVVSSTRVSHRYPNIAPAKGPREVRGLPAFVTQNEGIWSVTWMEHGVSYVVEAECSAPSEDARCGDETYVLALAEELSFVGGSFAGTAAPGDAK